MSKLFAVCMNIMDLYIQSIIAQSRSKHLLIQTSGASVLVRKEGIVSYFKELSVIGYDSFHGPNF